MHGALERLLDIAVVLLQERGYCRVLVVCRLRLVSDKLVGRFGTPLRVRRIGRNVIAGETASVVARLLVCLDGLCGCPLVGGRFPDINAILAKPDVCELVFDRVRAGVDFSFAHEASSSSFSSRSMIDAAFSGARRSARIPSSFPIARARSCASGYFP
jgi:hypothetical protein